MTERPSGTVTFLFSDIEGSTGLLGDLGADRYRKLLGDHRRFVREAVANAGGTEIDTAGDAFFVAFARAGDAARAAIETQLRLASHAWQGNHELRVRMGIHSTPPVLDGDRYVGIGVHRAARICSAGHGGQVLVSNATAELLRDADTTYGLIDLGLHRLKDLGEPEHLYQLAANGMADRFPPLRSLDNRPTNLPVQSTLLVGRQRELEQIAAALGRDAVRMVTLIGAGGSGKTRLVAVGDVATVKRLGPEALATSQALGDRWSEHFAHHFLGDCAVMEGDVPEAERRYRLSLEAAWQTGDQVESCYELQGMAMAAAASGDASRALHLAAAAASNIHKLGVDNVPPFWVALVDRHVAMARGQLGEERAADEWAAGSAMSMPEAVTEALM